MKIEAVIMDVDGVLADFDAAVCKQFGVDSLKIEPGKYDLWHGMGLTQSEFWARCDTYEFWSSIPEYKGAQAFWHLVGNWCDQRDVQLIVATMIPGRKSESLRGKADWLYDHFGLWPYQINFGPKVIDLSHGKQLVPLASSGRVLIDDYDRNTDAWVKSGGEAILVPRQWNKRHSECGGNVYATVYSELEQIAKGAR